jgi:S-DNA-T family DNA segregation ATPase FtsK/SpoIIIE
MGTPPRRPPGRAAPPPARRPRPPRARIDVPDNLWEHAFESAGITVAAVFILAVTATARHWPLIPVAVLVASAAAGALLVAHLITGGRSLTGYLACWAVLITGWYVWARSTSPWSLASVTALLGPALVLTPLGAVITARHARAAAEDAQRQSRAAERAAVHDWAGLFARFGVDGLVIVAVTPTRSGEMVHMRLPDHGRITRGHLEPLTERVEVARRLQRGSIRFEDGIDAAELIMHVTERDVLAETVPFPAEITPASVNGPKALGKAEDGAQAYVTFREVAALLSGVRGMGKSNLLNVITAQLAMCVDVVIFAIDLKSRFAAEWLLPWLRGQCPRPVIDWVATTKAEAALMIAAVEAAIAARSGALAGGGEKIIPTTALPAIMLLVDEVALIFGLESAGSRAQSEIRNAALAAGASRIVNVGRSEAVDPVFATLRATVSMMGGGDLKSQCDVRFGLGTNSRADAASVIPDDQRAAAVLARINSPGVMLLSVKGTPAPVVVKVFRLDPARIAAIAEATGYLRPEPDQLTAAAMGEAYASRWDRFAPVAEAWLAGTDTAPAGGGGTLALAAPPGAAPRRARPVDVDTEWERITGGLDDPEARLHPSHRRLREILAERGASGGTPSLLVAQLEREGAGVARETVQRWLAADAAAGLVRGTGTGLWHWNTGGGPS